MNKRQLAKETKSLKKMKDYWTTESNNPESSLLKTLGKDYFIKEIANLQRLIEENNRILGFVRSYI